MTRARGTTSSQIRKTMYRTDFIEFVSFAFQAAFPGRKLHRNWHIDIMADALHDTLRGQNTRLVINAPPRSLKSFVASIAFPAFALGRDPTLKIMSIVANRELAGDFCTQLARLLRSDQYRAIFPHVSFERSRNSLSLAHGGSFTSTPFFSSPIGRGADILIVDDPVAPSDALNERFNDEAAKWLASELVPRLNDKAKSIAVLVMQRLSYNDLSTAFFTNSDRRTLAFTAVSRRKERWRLSDGTAYIRPPRSVLNPATETLEQIYDIYAEIGWSQFVAQYLQDPWPPGSQWNMGERYYPFDMNQWKPGDGPPPHKSMFHRAIYIQYECFGVGEKPPYLPCPLTKEQFEEDVAVSQARLIELCKQDLE
jgi:hypothetical protein